MRWNQKANALAPPCPPCPRPSLPLTTLLEGGVCLLNICVPVRASRASEGPFLHADFIVVINPLYESSPPLGLQMPESKIFLSSKDKLFFSLQQILEKNIGSASTPSEILWGIYYIFRCIGVYSFSHKSEERLIHRGTFCCSESFLLLHTRTSLIADPGNHSVWSDTGKA